MKEAYTKYKSDISIWYGVAIVSIYGLLLFELISTLDGFVIQESINPLFDFFSHYGFVLYIISALGVWIATSLIIHLSALLLGGKCPFRRFLGVSAFPNFVSIIALILGLVCAARIPRDVDTMAELLLDRNVTIIKQLINWSAVPYYALYIILTRSFYGLEWIRAMLSVLLPFGMIFGLSELFKIV